MSFRGNQECAWLDLTVDVACWMAGALPIHFLGVSKDSGSSDSVPAVESLSETGSTSSADIVATANCRYFSHASRSCILARIFASQSVFSCNSWVSLMWICIKVCTSICTAFSFCNAKCIKLAVTVTGTDSDIAAGVRGVSDLETGTSTGSSLNEARHLFLSL